MADNHLDPVALWQEMLGRWERQINDFSAQISGNEMFAGPMNQVSKASMGARKSFDDAMEQLATTMMVATQPQMQDVIERLDRIEEQIAAIAAAIAPQDRPGTAAAQPAPRRTRKPPTGPA
ncbi:hypothetical protein ABC347_06825 [Sphingomonas sp. 1P06PA]|uniref:hypothetical protein n=1 Tax=Sphingomonas sp. 1P06PA TaxID=554121 RepID=UPI0039A4ACEF